MKPIALVIPWYGDEIRGGAETECNTLAHILQNAGCSVEVFTTCVRDASCDRGKNTLPEGAKHESGILVRRFLVRKRDAASFQNANHKIYNNLNFTELDEQTYFAEDINSPDMYKFIRENKDNYRCFIFIPYMYGVTYNGSACCMDKAVLIPCLHDESYAYMAVLKSKMPKFRGLIFHARPEEVLAAKLYDLASEKYATLGEGVDTSWHSSCSESRFRNKFNIHAPFIVYAGRKDKGKKVDELIDFFAQYKRSGLWKELKLVLMGSDTIDIPEDVKNDVIDLGFVSLEDKHDAFSAAVFLCNPSWFESFSLIIMESWIAKRPVLVSDRCAVTKNFCLETNGGLYYRNFADFKECIEYFRMNLDIADKMGENGFAYVLDNFSFDRIAQKYLNFISSLGL